MHCYGIYFIPLGKGLQIFACFYAGFNMKHMPAFCNASFVVQSICTFPQSCISTAE